MAYSGRRKNRVPWIRDEFAWDDALLGLWLSIQVDEKTRMYDYPNLEDNERIKEEKLKRQEMRDEENN